MNVVSEVCPSLLSSRVVPLTAALLVVLPSRPVSVGLAPTLPFCATSLFRAPALAPALAPSACALARGDLSRAPSPCAAHGDLALDPETNTYVDTY